MDPNDLDGDGILNELDNCPRVSNPAQHDEDGDRLGDRCDICPTIADPLQPDTTEIDALQFADKVGDACDPIPGRGGTKIAALHTFDTESTAWIGEGWTIEPSRDLATATTTAMWQHRQTTPGGAVVVAVRFSTVAWTGAGALTIVLDGDGVSGGMRCRIVHGPGGDDLEVTELGDEPMVTSLGSISPDAPVTLWLGRALNAQRKGVLDCKVDEGQRTTTLRKVTTDTSISGQYAFGSEDAVSEVSSVIVYTGPQPCPDTTARACPR